MEDKRDQLYNLLIGTRQVSERELGGSSEAFKSRITDEKSTRRFYNNLLKSGRFKASQLGTENEFYEAIKGDFEQRQAAAAEGSPVVQPTEQQMLEAQQAAGQPKGQQASAQVAQVQAERPMTHDNSGEADGLSAAVAQIQEEYPLTHEDSLEAGALLAGNKQPRAMNVQREAARQPSGFVQGLNAAADQLQSGQATWQQPRAEEQAPLDSRRVAETEARQRAEEQARAAERERQQKEKTMNRLNALYDRGDFFRKNMEYIMTDEGVKHNREVIDEAERSWNDELKGEVDKYLEENKEAVRGVLEGSDPTAPTYVSKYGTSASAFIPPMANSILTGRAIAKADDAQKVIDKVTAYLDEQDKKRAAQSGEAEAGGTVRDAALRRDILMKRAYSYLVEKNVPQNATEYILRSMFDSTLGTMAKSMTGKSETQKQIEAEGMQRYDASAGEKVGAMVGSIAMDLPVMAVTGGIGEAAGGATARLATRGAVKRLMADGLTREAAMTVAQRAVQQTGARYGIRAASEAANFASLEGVGSATQQLYNEGKISPWRLLIDASKGGLTGATMGIFGGANEQLTKTFERSFGGRTGKTIGYASSLGGRTSILAGSSVLGQYVSNPDFNINDVNWGEEFAHAGLMNLGFDAIGLMKRIKAERGRRHVEVNLTKGEIEQLNRAGVEGKNAMEIAEALMKESNASKREQQTKEGVANVADSEQVFDARQTVLRYVLENPDVDLQTKMKLGYLMAGSVYRLAPSTSISDVQRVGEGEYRVDVYNFSGQNNEIKIFKAPQEAEDYRQRMMNEVKPNQVAALEKMMDDAGKMATVTRLFDMFAQQFGRSREEIVQIYSDGKNGKFENEGNSEEANIYRSLENLRGNLNAEPDYHYSIDRLKRAIDKGYGAKDGWTDGLLRKKYNSLNETERRAVDDYITNMQYILQGESAAREQIEAQRRVQQGEAPIDRDVPPTEGGEVPTEGAQEVVEGGASVEGAAQGEAAAAGGAAEGGVQGEAPADIATALQRGAAIYAAHDPVEIRKQEVRAKVAENRLLNSGVSAEQAALLLRISGEKREEMISKMPPAQQRAVRDFLEQSDVAQGMRDSLDGAYKDETKSALEFATKMDPQNTGTVKVVELGRFGSSDKQWGVVLNGLQQDGALPDEGALIVVPIGLKDGKLDFSSFDTEKSMLINSKGIATASEHTIEDVVDSMLDDYSKEINGLTNTTIAAGREYDILPVEGDERSRTKVSVLSYDPIKDGYLVQEQGDDKVMFYPADELEKHVENAVQADVMKEYADADKAETERIAAEEKSQKEAAEAQAKAEAEAEKQRQEEAAKIEAEQKAAAEAQAKAEAEAAVKAEAERQAAEAAKSPANRLARKADGKPDYENSKPEDVKEYLINQLGDVDKVKNSIGTEIKSLKEKLKEQQAKIASIEQNMKESDFGIEEGMQAQEYLAEQKQVTEQIKKSIAYWESVNNLFAKPRKPRKRAVKRGVPKPSAKYKKFVKENSDNADVAIILSDLTPQTALEVAAEFLSSGVKLQRDSWMKHTGYGKKEAKKMAFMFAGKDKGGLTMEKAGELLDLYDSEGDFANKLDPDDATGGLNTLLELFHYAETPKDITRYIENNRMDAALELMRANEDAELEWINSMPDDAERDYYQRDFIERTADDYKQYLAERIDSRENYENSEEYNDLIDSFVETKVVEDGETGNGLRENVGGGESQSSQSSGELGQEGDTSLHGRDKGEGNAPTEGNVSPIIEGGREQGSDSNGADKDVSDSEVLPSDGREKVSGVEGSAGEQPAGEPARRIVGLEDYTPEELKESLSDYVSSVLDGVDGVDKIVGVEIIGSRQRGDAREDSDLDIVLQYEGDMKEDALFNLLHEEDIAIDGIAVDINPIRKEETGTLEKYLKRSAAYDAEVLAKRSGISNEKDERGNPFILAPDGTTVFGNIKKESGLAPAPIKLSQGFQKGELDGYGLAHIEARHGEDIRRVGFKSVTEFVDFVAKNYDKIKEGKVNKDGIPTYLIQIEDSHSNTLFVELSRDGSYWNVNSGGVFRKKYGKNYKDVGAESEAQHSDVANSKGSSLADNENKDNTPSAPNGEPQHLLDKGTENLGEKQEEKTKRKGAFFKMSPEQKAQEAAEQKAEAEAREIQEVQEKYDKVREEFANQNPKTNDIAAIIQSNSNVGGAIAALRTKAEEQRRVAENWRSRVYKENKTVVEGMNKASGADAYQTTIGAANERRRNAAIRVAMAAAEEYENFADRLAKRTGYKEQSLQQQIEAAGAEVNQSPTEAQKEAGNYKKGHVKVGEYDITIENPAGSVRRGTDANGKAWETTMQNTYGYLRGTKGVDGDHIDVFLSKDIDGWNGEKMFVVDQYNTDGTFDEHKVMMGFNDKEAAEKAYLSNYSEGWADDRKIVTTEVSKESFDKWIESSHRKTKAFADYAIVHKELMEQMKEADAGEIEEWIYDSYMMMGDADKKERARLAQEIEEMTAELDRRDKAEGRKPFSERLVEREKTIEQAANRGFAAGKHMVKDGFVPPMLRKFLEEKYPKFIEKGIAGLTRGELSDLIDELNKKAYLAAERWDKSDQTTRGLYSGIADALNRYYEGTRGILSHGDTANNNNLTFSPDDPTLAYPAKLSDKDRDSYVETWNSLFAGGEVHSRHSEYGYTASMVELPFTAKRTKEAVDKLFELMKDSGQAHGVKVLPSGVNDGKKNVYSNSTVNYYDSKTNAVYEVAVTEGDKQGRNKKAYVMKIEYDKAPAAEGNDVVGELAVPYATRTQQELKDKHDGAFVLFRDGDKYVCFGSDAKNAAQLFGKEMKMVDNNGEKVEYAEFPASDLDKNLPKLIRAGVRVAIADGVKAPESAAAPKPRATRKRTKVAPKEEFTGDLFSGNRFDEQPVTEVVPTESGKPMLFTSFGGLNTKAGEFAYVERQFTKSGEFSFTGSEEVKSADDVAYIFRELENKAIENVFVAIVKDGKPTIVHIGMGGATSSSADLDAIRAAAERAGGADQIYLVHNHPSGNLKCSAEDRTLLGKIDGMFAKGVVQEGIIIDTTSGYYGTFDSQGYGLTPKRPQEGGDTALEVLRFDKQVFNPDFDLSKIPFVNSSDDVAKLVSAQRLGSCEKVSYLILNQRGQVVANIHTTYSSLRNSDKLAAEIANNIPRFAGVRAIVYGEFELNNGDIKILNARTQQLTGHQNPITDIISVNGLHTWDTKSAFGERMMEPEVAYGQRNNRTTEEDKRRIIDEKGLVAPNLESVVANIVEVPRHDFTGTGKQAIEKAKKWAKDNLEGEYVAHKGSENEFAYSIDSEVIGKYLSESSSKESVNLGVHLATLKKLPEVIENSIDAERHADYIKDRKRGVENGIDNPNLIIHRLYGAVNIDGTVYRVKTTLKEYMDKNENVPYNYKVTEMELLKSGSEASDALSNSINGDGKTISGTKLFKGVVKSYDNGKKLLNDDEKTPTNGAVGEDGIRYSLKKDGKSLVGIHNISDEKLAFTLGLGGLANPSTAVVNIDKATLNNFGDISLIMPSSLVDKRTGGNAGTWAADAYTPRFPRTYKAWDSKSYSRFGKEVAGMPDGMGSLMQNAMNEYIEQNNSPRDLAYMFLWERGEAPEVVRRTPKYPPEVTKAVKALGDINHNAYDMTPEELEKLAQIYVDYTYASDKKEMYNGKSIFDWTKEAEPGIDTVEGIGKGRLDHFRYDVWDAARKEGEPNRYATGEKARDIVSEKGLTEEFEKWLDEKEKEYGVTKYLFGGYTPSGNRRNLPLTLENASKLMKKEGRAGAEGGFFSSGPGATRAQITKKLNSLEEMRKNKNRLVSHDEFEAVRKLINDRFFEMIGWRGMSRENLTDVLVAKDMSATAKGLGIDLTDEQLAELKEFKEFLMNAPTEYFETKFERPVKLNEFAAAVVPSDIAPELRAALEAEGMPIYEYQRGDEAARQAAVKAASEEDGIRFSLRKGAAPKKTGVGYKVFVLGKDGKLYPPMVANPGGADTPVGVWLNADAAPVAGTSKTGRLQVKQGGKGTQGGSGRLAYRPGWHLGEIPYALQFNRVNPETGERELFPSNFVWAEVEYADDVDYQKEAMSYGMNPSGKFQHSLAGLPRVPENGSYRYRTNPNPETDPWIITGAMKVNRILTPTEVDEMVRKAGREPQPRQEGSVTDEQVAALNNQFVKNRFIGEKGAERLDKANEVTTRTANLVFARELESKGKSELDVKLATGWERGADGKWRYETPDLKIKEGKDFNKMIDAASKAKREAGDRSERIGRQMEYVLDKIKRYPARNRTDEQKAEVKELRKQFNRLSKEFAKANNVYFEYRNELDDYLAGRAGTLEEWIDDPELFKAYPELAKVPVMMENKPGYKGSTETYSGKVVGIRLSRELQPEEMRKTMIHEVQHAIQNMEGFAEGGNTTMVEIARMDIRRDTESMKSALDKAGYSEWLNEHPDVMAQAEQERSFDAERNFVDTLPDGIEKENATFWLDRLENSIEKYRPYVGRENESAWEVYQRFAGEVEARNAARRADYSDELRRETLAMDTEDVAREDQLFLNNAFDNYNESLSLPGESISDDTPASSERGREMAKADSDRRKRIAPNSLDAIEGYTIQDILDGLPEGLSIVDEARVANAARRADALAMYVPFAKSIVTLPNNGSAREMRDSNWHENFHYAIDNVLPIGGKDRAKLDRAAAVIDQYDPEMAAWIDSRYSKAQAAEEKVVHALESVISYMEDNGKTESIAAGLDFGNDDLNDVAGKIIEFLTGKETRNGRREGEGHRRYVVGNPQEERGENKERNNASLPDVVDGKRQVQRGGGSGGEEEVRRVSGGTEEAARADSGAGEEIKFSLKKPVRREGESLSSFTKRVREYEARLEEAKRNRTVERAEGESEADRELNDLTQEMMEHPSPMRRRGETDADYDARKAEWEKWNAERRPEIERRLEELRVQTLKERVVQRDNEMNEAEALLRGKKPGGNAPEGFAPDAPDGVNDFTEEEMRDVRRDFQDKMDDMKILTTKEQAKKDIKQEIIERRRFIDSSNLEDAFFVDELKKIAGSKEVLRAIPDYIEGNYRGAETEELRRAAKMVTDWFEDAYNQMAQEGVLYNAPQIQNYVTHIWDWGRSSKEAQEKYNNYVNSMRLRSPYTRHRVIPSYAEGIAMGMVPKYDDITGIITEYGNYVTETIANRRIINFLRNFQMDVPAGKDNMPMHVDIVVSDDVRDPIYSRMNHTAWEGYKILNMVKPMIAPVFGEQHILDHSQLNTLTNKLVNGIWVTSSLMKKINLSFSFFHHGALTETAIAMLKPWTAGKVIAKNLIWDVITKGNIPAMNDKEAARDAVKHLVSLGATNDYSTADVQNFTTSIYKFTKDKNIPVAKQAAFLLDFLNKGMDKLLWDAIHDGYKIASFTKLAKEIRQKGARSGWTEQQTENALDEAGHLVNDTFGGLHFDILGYSPKSVRIMRALLLSPDWTLATIRQALSPFGFGRLYNDDGAWKAMFGGEPSSKMRRKYGRQFWLTAGIFFYGMMNGLNAYFRTQDEDEQKRIADEKRKGDPEYKSPYELAYPKGMSWYDYTMPGNTLGHQTHLFTGRYSDGTESYARWGKQFRELPELLFGRDGLSFPGPMIDKMAGKANPLMSTAFEFLSGYSLSGYANKDMKDKKGVEKDVARLYMLAKKFLPYSIPTQEDKDFLWLDLVMPSSKGFTPYKATSYFEKAIKSGDSNFVAGVYNACVMNGLNPERFFNVAKSKIEAEAKQAQMEGVEDIDQALVRFDDSKDIKERKRLKRYIEQQMGAQDYHAISQAEMVAKAQEIINGEEQPTSTAEERYLSIAGGEDILDDYRMKKAMAGLKSYYDDYKSLAESDAKAAARMAKEKGKYLTGYQITNSYRNAISRMKRVLGKPGVDDAKILEEIRKAREQWKEEMEEIEK